MKSKLVLLLLILSSLSTLSAASTFSASGRDLFLNGQEFEIKGLCYQPTPIGESGAQAPFGDYYTFSPRNQEIWDRDFANFRKMGANVIRLYGWGTDGGVDHTAFLDQAYNGGDQPVYVLINRYINPDTNWLDETAINALLADWEAIATELADHPAIMGFLIGNEVNSYFNSSIGAVNGDSPLFWLAMEQLAFAVKTIAPDKLVSVAITDRPDQISVFDDQITTIDFWAMQVYRGNSFTNLITQFAAASDKPLVITEFGYDALDGRVDTEWPNNAELPANAMEALWNELRADDAAGDVIAGACVFEYADEWWKDQAAGNLTVQDVEEGWNNPSFEDGEGNEEWWGIFRISNPQPGVEIDTLTPRAMFYRLAAMWNEPFKAVLYSGLSGTDLEVSFNYPLHLRDQALEVEMSTDLNGWTTVAHNAASQYLSSSDSSVFLTSQVVDETVQVSLLKDPAASGDQELLLNGGFETGNTDGWITGGSVLPVTAQSGTFSLVLDAPGGFVAPAAFQTVPANPGETFTLSGYLYTVDPLPANATFGLLKIVFQDANGADLEPASISIGQFGPPENPGAEALPFLNAESPVGEWIFSEVRAVAPAETTDVEFFLIIVGESAATMGFDSISATRSSGAGDAGSKVFFRLVNNGR